MTDILRALPEVRYTLTTINTGNANGKNYANIYVRLVDRHQRSRNVDEISAYLRPRLQAIAGIKLTHVGLREAVGGQSRSSSRSWAQILTNWPPEPDRAGAHRRYSGAG